MQIKFIIIILLFQYDNTNYFIYDIHQMIWEEIDYTLTVI